LNPKRKRLTAMSELRRQAINSRRKMTAPERQLASVAIADRLIHCHEFTAAKSIACYLPMDDEVDPSRIVARAWRAKKRIFCPVTDLCGGMNFCRLRPGTLLERNQFGIWEPVGEEHIAPPQLDLVVTPLVAFDDQRNRIGMGGGYFDRAFAFLKHRRRWLRPKLIGVAFDCQKVEKITPNPWDIRLYRIITESA